MQISIDAKCPKEGLLQHHFVDLVPKFTGRLLKKNISRHLGFYSFERPFNSMKNAAMHWNDASAFSVKRNKYLQIEYTLCWIVHGAISICGVLSLISLLALAPVQWITTLFISIYMRPKGEELHSEWIIVPFQWSFNFFSGQWIGKN